MVNHRPAEKTRHNKVCKPYSPTFPKFVLSLSRDNLLMKLVPSGQKRVLSSSKIRPLHTSYWWPSFVPLAKRHKNNYVIEYKTFLTYRWAQLISSVTSKWFASDSFELEKKLILSVPRISNPRKPASWSTKISVGAVHRRYGNYRDTIILFRFLSCTFRLSLSR